MLKSYMWMGWKSLGAPLCGANDYLTRNLLDIIIESWVIFWERLRSRWPLVVVSSKLCTLLQSTFARVSIILLTPRIDLFISKGNSRRGRLIEFLPILNSFFIDAILNTECHTASVSDVSHTLANAYAVCVDALIESQVFLAPWDCPGWPVLPTFVKDQLLWF